MPENLRKSLCHYLIDSCWSVFSFLFSLLLEREKNKREMSVLFQNKGIKTVTKRGRSLTKVGHRSMATRHNWLPIGSALPQTPFIGNIPSNNSEVMKSVGHRSMATRHNWLPIGSALSQTRPSH